MNIIEEWRNAKFQPPKVALAVDIKSGNNYLVVEDFSTIIKLVDVNGNLYMIAKKWCSVEIGNNLAYYSCNGAIHPVSCSKVENERDRFAVDVLRSKFL